MKIHSKQSVPNVSKPEGTKVTYFLFPEYEVHYNEQIPSSTQTWHHHEKIWESIFIIDGALTAKWRESGKEKKKIVKKGDLIETENTPHTFVNHTKKIVKFLVIKQVLSGKNNKKLFKTDKVLD